MSGFAVQFNKNSFGLAPGNQQQVTSITELGAGQSKTCLVQVLPNTLNSNEPPAYPLTVDIAMKNNLDIWYFKAQLDLGVVMVTEVALSNDQFQTSWRNLEAKETVNILENTNVANVETSLEGRVKRSNMLLVSHTLPSPDTHLLYVAGCTTNRLAVFGEITIKPGAVKVATRTEVPHLVTLFQNSVQKLLSG